MTISRRSAVRVHPALPVFRLAGDGGAIFYTPGQAVLVADSAATDVEAALTAEPDDRGSEAARLAGLLRDRGLSAQRAWQQQAERPFAPHCLTLYLSNHCDLSCSYCCSAPGRPSPMPTPYAPRLVGGVAQALPFGDVVLSEAPVEQAAALVADYCVRATKPLTVVFHGGGEPTLHWDLLTRLHAIVSRVARAREIPLWTYLATHGVIPEDKAVWLAQRINRIGLSCDGPPEIQDVQRSARGNSTSAVVERTARVLQEEGAEVVVRATITPASVDRQDDIVRYVHERLGCRQMRLEPVYRGRRPDEPFSRQSEAEAFLEGFVRAATVAARFGCDLDLSGVRLTDLHGPFCNPLRDVLQIVPGGQAAACFLSTGSDGPLDDALAFGKVDPAGGEFVVDWRRADELKRRAARVPAVCNGCVNIYHCARECPDHCPALAGSAPEPAGFRCLLHQGLAEWRIRQMVVSGVGRWNADGSSAGSRAT